MSMFREITVNCPQCAKAIDFKVVISVNAVRRPDLRAAILDRSFQRQPCPQCGTTFRLDPEMTYVDVGRGQWITAYPVAKLGQWKALEEQARATFALAYGPQAPSSAQKLGAKMKPRIAFGWGGLREKLVAAEHQLDDVNLELVKLSIVRNSESVPLSNDNELRFLDVEADKLVMAWIRATTEQPVETLKVPRQLYDDIAANTTEWQALREELSAGAFVDMNRLLVVAA